MTAGRIQFEASPEILDVISGIGRTEDIRLSPDDRRLAIVDFYGNKIFLFSIWIDRSLATPRVTVSDYSVISSASMAYPHGVAFLGHEHLVVCNRAAGVDVYRIPTATGRGHGRGIKPLQSINGRGYLRAAVKTPGSVDCVRIADCRYRILVCNNHWHFVTSHIVDLTPPVRIRNRGVLVERGLKIPDGISVSRDNTWIAISNHVSGEVLIYRNTPNLNGDTPPASRLRGPVCPHGLRFSPDGMRVFVADAASQYLFMFERKGSDWAGAQEPSQSIRLMDDASFYARRIAAGEGGVKGIDIDSANEILVTSHSQDVIAFYDLERLLAQTSTVDQAEMANLCHQRDRSIERHHKETLNRRWNLTTRVKYELGQLRRLGSLIRRGSIRASLLSLHSRNRWSRESILDPSGPVVSLTSHDNRIPLVFYAIESIGRGSCRPSRIILWLGDKAVCENPPVTLRRLQSRGLEIIYSEDMGPHTKYYPYIDREMELHRPLVTADDDMLYPRDWLKRLVDSHDADPSAIHCYRAHRMRLNRGRLLPYNEWSSCQGRSPSHLNFVTAVCGAIYPSEFQKYLKQQGPEFERCCSKGDDIWITVNALRAGFKIAQIGDRSAVFPVIPGSQERRLFDTNILGAEYQYQLIETFSKMDLANLTTQAAAEQQAPGS